MAENGFDKLFGPLANVSLLAINYNPSMTWDDSECTKLRFYQYNPGSLKISDLGSAWLNGVAAKMECAAHIQAYLALQIKTPFSTDQLIKDFYPVMDDQQRKNQITDIDLVPIVNKILDKVGNTEFSSLGIPNLKKSLHMKTGLKDKEDEITEVVYPLYAALLFRLANGKPKEMAMYLEKFTATHFLFFYESKYADVKFPIISKDKLSVIANTLQTQKKITNTVLYPYIFTFLKKENDPDNRSVRLLQYTCLHELSYSGLGLLTLVFQALTEKKDLTLPVLLHYCYREGSKDSIKKMLDITNEYEEKSNRKFWPWCRLLGANYIKELSIPNNLFFSCMLAAVIDPSGEQGPWQKFHLSEANPQAVQLKKIILPYMNNLGGIDPDVSFHMDSEYSKCVAVMQVLYSKYCAFSIL